MTYEEASEALNKMFWDTFKVEALAILGYVPTVYWPFVTEPTSAPIDKVWCRVSRKTNPKELAGFGEGNANFAARYDTDGLYYVQMFYPQSDKSASSKFTKLAQIAESCFLGKHDPSNLLWVRSVETKELDSEKTWFRLNVIIEFTYQEIRGS